MSIGKWQVQFGLGSGAYGDVVAAFDAQGTAVAIKTPTNKIKQKVPHDGTIAWEIYVLKMFKHEHLMTLIEASDTLDNEYIVMPLYAGTIHDAYLNDPAPNLVMPVLKQLLSAIAYIHEQGYAHCDVSPNNVMITKFPQKGEDNIHVVLGDFGSVRLVNSGGVIDTDVCNALNINDWCVTCVWAASPECRANGMVDSQACDVWAATTTALSINGLWHKGSGWWREPTGPVFDKVFNDDKHTVLRRFVPSMTIAKILASFVFQPQIFRESAACVLESISKV